MQDAHTLTAITQQRDGPFRKRILLSAFVGVSGTAGFVRTIRSTTRLHHTYVVRLRGAVPVGLPELWMASKIVKFPRALELTAYRMDFLKHPAGCLAVAHNVARIFLKKCVKSSKCF